MAFRVVQLHNGAIDFTSEVNRGTTFRITLPADPHSEPQHSTDLTPPRSA
jgi:signal transduction histidine kinase